MESSGSASARGSPERVYRPLKRLARSRDLSGRRFGQLVARECLGIPIGYGARNSWWRCDCDCGQQHDVNASGLNERSVCRRPRKNKAGRRPSRAKEYIAWQRLKRLPAGLVARWRSFEALLEDVGPAPERGAIVLLDRSKPAGPDTCRWGACAEKMRRTRRARTLTAWGVTRSLAEWAEIRGLPRETLWQRILNGWSPAQALRTPKQPPEQNGRRLRKK